LNNDNKDDTDDASSPQLPVLEPLGVGIRRDFSRRWPHYFSSDLRDGLNAQTLAATLFLLFACLAPAVGFGSLLQVATVGEMGVLEMCASTALSGCVYAVAAPQPLQLIGPMGPVLAYQMALFQLSRRWQLPFLAFNAAVGLWTAAFLLVCSLTSASHLVRRLTRFTDEIFSVVVSTIFILGAVTDVMRPFTAVSNSIGNTTPATALLTLTCASLTFGLPLLLRQLPRTRYFTRGVRQQLANFAPALGVVAGSLAARVARLQWQVALPALQLPQQFAPTRPRPWLLLSSLGEQLPVWARWAAALPALFAAVLLFLDQNITARIVNQPQWKQVKGRSSGDGGSLTDGMHGDMLVISLLTAVTSVLGLPWMVGATTRTAAHVRSLTLRDDTTGEITGCLEQRLSGFAIHALIGMAVVWTAPRRLLQQVPLAALSGVFLFLGFTSLQGLQLWDRIRGLFQERADNQPWAKLPRRLVTGFTVAQMACVAAMIRISQSKFGVISPLVVAVLPLVRWTLLKTGLIDRDAMEVLDGK